MLGGDHRSYALPGASGRAAVPIKRGGSRHIPAAVRTAVWDRDGGQCAFVARSGHRCAQRSFLQSHHLQPFALRGPATIHNIALRCGRHNQYEGELDFGADPAVYA